MTDPRSHPTMPPAGDDSAPAASPGPGDAHGLVPASEQAVRALYAARGWDAPATPAEVLEAHPAIAAHLARRPTDARRARASLAHLAVHAAVILGLAALVGLGSWKAGELLGDPEVRRVGLALEPAPFDLDAVPPGAKAAVARVNEALEARAWGRAAEEADALLLEGALPGPADGTRLLEVVMAASVLQGMDDASVGRRAHFSRAVARYLAAREQGGYEPGFRSQYAYAVSLFELQGAAGGLGAPTGERLHGGLERVLSTVSDLRTRFGAGITADRDLHPRLLKIEGYTLARRLFESDGILSVGRWFEPDAANARRWLRLEQVLADWDEASRGAVDPDLLRLRLWFWEAAHSFCNVPGKEETVRIGSWSRSESRIEAEIAAAEAALERLP